MFVKITSFGGILPALKPRALPADGAQTNRNLLASVPDFRPLATDLNVSATPGALSNPKTLYRLDRKVDGSFNIDMTTGWVANAAEVSYVRGPINNDLTERTYYTFDDGSAPPRWLDVNGTDRILGVPKPTGAPIALPFTVDEFTPDERVSELNAAWNTIVQAIRTNATAVWRGGTEPGGSDTGATGYINLQANQASPATQGKQMRVWRLSSTGTKDGTVTNLYGATYSGLGLASGPSTNLTWAMDPAIGGFFPTINASSPAWTYAGAPGGTYPDHLAVAFTSYALTYDIATSALTTAIAAIPMPGKTDGTKLFDSTQVATLVTRINAKTGITQPEPAAKLAALKQAVEELRTVLNGGMAYVINAQIAAYYASAPIQDIFDKQIDTWAGKVFDAAQQIVNSAVPYEDYGGYFNGF